MAASQDADEIAGAHFRIMSVAGFRLHDEKFVTAHSHDEVAIRRCGTQKLGDLDQHQIPDHATVEIVDRPKLRDVDVENGDSPCHFVGALKNYAQPVLERRAISETGQRVEESEIAELCTGLRILDRHRAKTHALRRDMPFQHARPSRRTEIERESAKHTTVRSFDRARPARTQPERQSHRFVFRPQGVGFDIGYLHLLAKKDRGTARADIRSDGNPVDLRRKDFRQGRPRQERQTLARIGAYDRTDDARRERFDAMTKRRQDIGESIAQRNADEQLLLKSTQTLLDALAVYNGFLAVICCPTFAYFEARRSAR